MTSIEVFTYDGYPTTAISGTSPILELRGTLVGGEYFIQKWIGSGSHADVFLATDKNGKYFAVKVENALFPESRLREEFNVLKRLSNAGAAVPRPEKFIEETVSDEGAAVPHPKKIIKETVDEDESHFIFYRAMVMQYLPLTFEMHLNDSGWLSPGDILRIAREAIEVIASIHQQGIIHGGITERDLAFDKDGKLVLIDFSRCIGEPKLENISDEMGWRIEVSYRADLRALVLVLWSLIERAVPRLPKNALAEERVKFQHDVSSLDHALLLDKLPQSFVWLKRLVAYSYGLSFTGKPDYALLSLWFPEA